MTLRVGLNRKLGQPEFGSLGASCDVELELDGTLLFHDPDALQIKIRAAYEACERAISEELARQTRHETTPSAQRSGSSNGHGEARGNGHANGAPRNGSAKNGGGPRQATTSQIRALHAIANRQGLTLTDVLQDRFRLYKAEDLSVAQASQLIDELKGSPVGTG